MPLERFKKNIISKKARVGVVGLGYVGLPLAVSFAKAGFKVTGIDTDRSKVACLKKGGSYILDVSAAAVRDVTRRDYFHAVSDFKAVGSLDAVIICVPTPLAKTKEPDMSFILGAARGIAKHLKKGQLVTLESTTYPGTTDEVLRPVLEKSGLKAERDFFLAFSPERIDPGNKTFGTTTIPKVIGGIGPASTEAARLLYGSVVKCVVPVSSARAAEMTKLLENTFRSANIALINEMAMVADKLGIDIWEVIEAAKTKPFGFMAFYPGPGTGGHCLPVDPLYLSWKSMRHGHHARMIELASEINKSMPDHVVERLVKILNAKRVPAKRARVLVLGVTYKRDIDDLRESPALDVIEGLVELGATVSYSDPFVKRFTHQGRSYTSQTLSPLLLKKQDIVLLLTDHSAFDKAMIERHARLIFDTRNVFKRPGSDGRLFVL